MADLKEVLSNTPSLLVVFQGDVNREHEGHIVHAMKNAAGGEAVDYRHHAATENRPEERIYFYKPTKEAEGAAAYIGDLQAYHGLTTYFVKNSMGIHLPADGGIYAATHKLVVQDPTVVAPSTPAMA